MALSAGDTFILLHETGDTPHLWVLLWRPAGTAGAFLAVHLTTLRAHSDRACVIRAGEHPFVQNDTCAAYNNPKRISSDRLAVALRNRQAFQRDPVSSEVLARLRRGFLASPYTPHAFTRMAREDFGAAEP